MKKKILTIFGVIFLLAMVYLAGHYRVLPAHHIRSALEFVKERVGKTEQVAPRPTESVDFLDTHLTRLLVKKIPLQEYDGNGGGVSASGDLIFISSNKGELSIYDAESYTRLEDNIGPLPMNYSGLVNAGHTARNSFRNWWFRVNGFFSEVAGDNSYSLYLSHNYFDEERDCISHHISRIEMENEEGVIRQIGAWRTLFSAEPCFDPEPEGYVSAVPYSGHISGGAIQPLSDDYLLITVGDYNHHGLGEMPNYAQDPEIPYGKFIKLHKGTGSWSVFASGSRNPSGLHIDSEGTIWSVENGPEGGDELNIIKENENYGWPEVSYGIWYTPAYPLTGIDEAGRHEGFRTPIYAWLRAVAPSSIVRLENDRFPLWSGDLLVGTMRGQGVRRLRLDSDNRVVYDEEVHIGHRIRDIAILQNGLIALLTDDRYLIVLDDGGPSFEEPSPWVANRMSELEKFDNMISDDFEREENRTPAMVYEQHCATCHLLNKRSGIGPHLTGLFGREVGAADDYNYSSAFRNDTRIWDEYLLRSLLTEPDAEFRGNRMNRIELTEDEIDKLVRFFESREGE